MAVAEIIFNPKYTLKLSLKTIEVNPNESFYIQRQSAPCWDGNWHYHEEYELIYLIEGQGIRLVGDNISRFNSGELVLLGPWLPHLWRNGDVDSEPHSVDRIIIKFKNSFAGQELFLLPELQSITQLLLRSVNGIQFGESIRKTIHPQIIRLAECHEYQKIVTLIEIFGLLSRSDDYHCVSTPGFKYNSHNLSSDSRLSKIISYISDHYHENPSLDKISDMAAMTTNSFCRFFKKKTNKSYIQFINELKAGKACQLLINGDKSNHEISIESGFNSLSTFNRVFKHITNRTPTEYRNKYASFSQ